MRSKIFMLLPAVFAVLSAHGATLWVEGEAASEKEVRHNGWYAGVKKEKFSGEKVLTHWGETAGKASFPVEIPEAGRYALWLRVNPVQSAIKVRVGEGAWWEPNLRRDSFEKINVAEDNRPDLRFIAWVKVGEVALDEGRNRVEVRFTSSNHFHGMLDCFCLTTDLAWKPRKTLKPGEEPPHWPVPEITRGNLGEWIDFIRPSSEELGWRAVRWHRSLSEAAEEAEALGRPILLWAMNGHPCGET